MKSDVNKPNQQADPSAKRKRNAIIVALVLDLISVLVFATIGRASHSLELSAIGVVETAWPFFIGLWVGWAPVWTRRKPLAFWPTALWVWAATAVVGLLFRMLSNNLELAPPFAIVATAFLALFLIGWRVIAVIVRKIFKFST